MSKLPSAAVKANSPRTRPAALLASVFGLGYLPIAPGTFGSLAGLPLGYGLALLPIWQAAALLVALTALAVAIAGHAEAIFGGHDASQIVIDEVVGMAIALLGVPTTFGYYVASFALFRLLDATKPGPIGWLDRRVRGGLGVVLDDVAAGAATLGLVQLVRLTLH